MIQIPYEQRLKIALKKWERLSIKTHLGTQAHWDMRQKVHSVRRKLSVLYAGREWKKAICPHCGYQNKFHRVVQVGGDGTGDSLPWERHCIGSMQLIQNAVDNEAARQQRFYRDAITDVADYLQAAKEYHADDYYDDRTEQFGYNQ